MNVGSARDAPNQGQLGVFRPFPCGLMDCDRSVTGVEHIALDSVLLQRTVFPSLTVVTTAHLLQHLGLSLASCYQCRDHRQLRCGIGGCSFPLTP